IIFPDADIQRAVDAAMLAKFRNVGQSCIAANRVYVHESIKQDFVEAYAEKVRKMKVGNPFSEETDIGPLVDTQALEKVKNHVRDAVARGARIVVGSQSEGLTYFPTV